MRCDGKLHVFNITSREFDYEQRAALETTRSGEERKEENRKDLLDRVTAPI